MDHFEDLIHKYCERYEKELDDQFHKIEKAPAMSPSDVEIIGELWRTMKAIKTVESMVSYDERGGYSGTTSVRFPRIRHSDDYSGRSRDSMGRYTRDSEKSEMIRMLEDKMRNVRSEDEAIAIQDAMDAISRLR